MTIRSRLAKLLKSCPPPCPACRGLAVEIRSRADVPGPCSGCGVLRGRFDLGPTVGVQVFVFDADNAHLAEYPARIAEDVAAGKDPLVGFFESWHYRRGMHP